MTHLLFFTGGLGMVIYGVYINTKSDIQLRKQLMKKYVLMYIISVAICNMVIYPIFLWIKG